MKKMTLIFIMILVMILTFPSNAKSYSEPPKPKLDINKMVLDLIKAIENRDYELYRSLFVYPEKESRFNELLDEREAEGYQDYSPDKLRIFPKIGELPEWITFAIFEFHFIEDDNKVELSAFFILKDNTWLIRNIEPDIFTEEPDKLSKSVIKKISRGHISPPPPDGERTLDAGLNEIMQKFVSDFTEKNWESIKEYTPQFKNPYKLSFLKKKEKKFGELLSQFPLIGPIPAPAMKVRVSLKGTLEGKEIDMKVSFEWEENALRIYVLNVNY